MYRPQFAMPNPVKGFVWQPCVYQFDATNTPAFANIALVTNQETGHIPLSLDADVPFLLLGAKIQDSLVNVELWDPWGNMLMDGYLAPQLYASELPPFTVLEGPGIYCPAASVLQARLQGQ